MLKWMVMVLALVVLLATCLHLIVVQLPQVRPWLSNRPKRAGGGGGSSVGRVAFGEENPMWVRLYNEGGTGWFAIAANKIDVSLGWLVDYWWR